MAGISLKPVSATSVFQAAFPERFKAKQGEGYRLWLPEIDHLFRAKTHYLRPNYVFCLSAPENGINKRCPVCETGEYSRWRYGMNIIVFKTDVAGKLRPVMRPDASGKDVESVDWEVKLWLFSQTVANDLYAIASSWNMLEHDVKVLCLDEKRGKLSIQAHPESVFHSKEELQPLLLDSLKSRRRDPVKELGVLQSEAEMLQGIASGANKRDNPPPAQRRFPESEIRSASLSSPSVISSPALENKADKKMADETISGNANAGPHEATREISNDKEFDELLTKIKSKAKG